MNKKQRLVLAIFIPIIILFITLAIANNVGYTVRTRAVSEDSIFYEFSKTYTYHEGNPFDWGRTWYIWVLSLTFCCIFEYKLFAEKKKIKNSGRGKTMKKFERIFLYSVLAILVFYVFLVDGNVESQVAIQEEIMARRIVILNNEGQKVVILSADERTGGGGRIDICNKSGDSVVAAMGTAKDDGGIMINNKEGAHVVIMRVSKDDGIIHICNRDGKVIGHLP